MSKIKIYFNGVSSANLTLRAAIHELNNLEQEFARLQKSVDLDIQSRYQLAERLSALRRSAEAAEEKSKKLLALTDSGLQKYQETESRLCRFMQDDEV